MQIERGQVLDMIILLFFLASGFFLSATKFFLIADFLIAISSFELGWIIKHLEWI